MRQHVATNFSRIILAFAIHADAPGGPAAFFNQLSNFTQMFGSTLYVMQTLLGDATVVSRRFQGPAECNMILILDTIAVPMLSRLGAKSVSDRVSLHFAPGKHRCVGYLFHKSHSRSD